MKRLVAVKGVALISVMLIVALSSILATQMTARLLLQMQRADNISSNQQAYWYAMSAEAFAKRVLITSFEKESKVTNLEQPWAQGENTYPVEFGEITGEITDLQACFNLNALRIEKAPQGQNPPKESLEKKAFMELLLAIDLENVSPFEAEYMAYALIDWLDEDSAIASAGGAEDNDYSAKEFAYLPANHYLASLKELRIIEHFSIKTINAIKEYVCVLPHTNLHKININTLSTEHVELLMALLTIPRDVAEQVLSAREGKGFATTDELFKLQVLTQYKITDQQKEQFVVDSEYFKLKTTASFNNSYFSLSSIMKVAENNQVNVISRTIGRD
ncbi:MAG: general secretion pathway protein K [Alteromonadaceae bacterium]